MFKKALINLLIIFIFTGCGSTIKHRANETSDVKKSQGFEVQKPKKGAFEVAKIKSKQSENKRLKDTVREKDSVTFKPIIDYIFEEEIADALFDETEMKVTEARILEMKGLEQMGASETVKVPYPRVVMIKNKETSTKDETFIESIKFINEKRVLEREVLLKGENYEEPLVSITTGKLVAHGVKGKGEDRNHYLRWLDEQGKVKKIEEGGGEFFQVSMAKDGKYIFSGDSTYYALHDIDGNNLWKRKRTEREEFWWWGDHLNGGQIILIETLRHKDEVSLKNEVSLIDIKGEKIWSYPLPYAESYEILSSKNEKFILYADFIENKDEFALYGFKEDGELLWNPKTFEGFNNKFHDLNISKNSNLLVGLSLWDYLWCMDIDTSNIIWRYPLKGMQPDNIAISPDGKYVLLGDKFLLDGESGDILKHIEDGYKFLFHDLIWRKKGSKLEILNILEKN